VTFERQLTIAWQPEHPDDAAERSSGHRASRECRHYQRHVITKPEPGLRLADFDSASCRPLLRDEHVVQVEALPGRPAVEVSGSRLRAVRLLEVRVVGAFQTEFAKALHEPRVTTLRVAIPNGVAVEVAGDNRRPRTDELLMVVERGCGVVDEPNEAPDSCVQSTKRLNDTGPRTCTGNANLPVAMPVGTDCSSVYVPNVNTASPLIECCPIQACEEAASYTLRAAAISGAAHSGRTATSGRSLRSSGSLT